MFGQSPVTFRDLIYLNNNVLQFHQQLNIHLILEKKKKKENPLNHKKITPS